MSYDLVMCLAWYEYESGISSWLKVVKKEAFGFREDNKDCTQVFDKPWHMGGSAPQKAIANMTRK